MGPKRPPQRTDHDLFRMELVNLIDLRHELVRLERLIDWGAVEAHMGTEVFTSGTGRPALSPRLVASLLYLKHISALSDEEVVARWVENPYWQHFSGERWFRHELPCDASSLTRWRQRLGEEGCEWLLTHTIQAAQRAGAMNASSLGVVAIDTTVQPKAIAYPTDSRLLDRARAKLVAAAKDAGIALRQSYARVGPQAERMAGRYAHARQFKRMHARVRQLRTWLGRVIRDAQRGEADAIEAGRLTPGGAVQMRLHGLLAIAERLHAQRPEDRNKLYSIHAPEVEAIAKGKARTPWEFGTKVTVAVTAKEGFVVGMRAMPGSPYDGHTLDEQLEQVEILTGTRPHTALVDRGYRGGDTPAGVRVLISHMRGLPKRLKRLLKRRQIVEPVIGHMKNDGQLDRNWLKGSTGDALHALLEGAAHNLRWLLAWLRGRCCANVLHALQALAAVVARIEAVIAEMAATIRVAGSGGIA